MFKKYKVLSKRELESRYEVFPEQYAVNINIEAETAASIARTMMLPAAVRYLNELRASGLEELVGEIEPLIKELHFALRKLEDANLPENQPGRARRREKWARRTCATRDPRRWTDVRDVSPTACEKLVADDLWPLPKYSEMLFIIEVATVHARHACCGARADSGLGRCAAGQQCAPTACR